MISISLNAFSFLRRRLAEKKICCPGAGIEVRKGAAVRDLIAGCGLAAREVEAVFLNGRLVPRDRELRHGDRVALVPPGTPGPYRVLLGMRKPPQAARHRRPAGKDP